MRLCGGSVPANPEFRLIRVTGNHTGAATATPGACGAQVGESPTEAGTRRFHDYRLDYGKGDGPVTDAAVLTVPRHHLPYPALPRSTDLCGLSLADHRQAPLVEEHLPGLR